MAAPAIEKKPYPLDGSGQRMTLEKMGQFIREAAVDPNFQQFAEAIILQAGVPAKEHISNLRAATIMLDYVRKNVRYRPDPLMVELVKSAPITLCVPGAAMCIPVEDCDGLCVALGSLLMAYGVPVRILKQEYGRPELQDHVIIMFSTEDGRWLAADPSNPSSPIGQRDPAVKEEWVDPADPKSIGLPNAPEAQFVAIGAPHDGRELLHHRGVWHERLKDGSVEAFIGEAWRPVGKVSRHVGLGSLANLHTVSDLEDFEKAISYQWGELSKVANACTEWKAKDPAGWDAWKSDFDTVNAEWKVVDAAALATISVTPSVMTQVTIAELQWQGIVAIDSRMIDLDRRMRVAGFCNAPDYKGTPQPANKDLDLTVYNLSGKALDALKQGADTTGRVILWTGVAVGMGLIFYLVLRGPQSR